MKLLSRLAIAILICVLLIPALAVPAQAQDDPSISLSPSSGPPGEEVTVRGYDFDDEEDVEIYFYRKGTSSTHRIKVATDETDDEGDFRVTFTVPESYSGEHRVRVIVDTTVDDFFTVEPILEIDPDEGPVGMTVEVKGMGFGDEEEDIEVRYYFDSSNYKKVKQDIIADEYGSWETSFKIPASSSGSHRIDARGDDNSLAEVEDASFEVRPGISINKASGKVGAVITVNGSGFEEDERDIEIFFDGTVVAEGITANDNGTWEETFALPEMPKGSYDVTAEGRKTDKEDISAASFNVNPNLMLTPVTGHVGSELSVSGTGFAADKEIIITYGDSQQGTSATNGKGSFSNVTFSTPKSIHGEHTVTAEDALGNAAPATFTMESQPPAKPALISPSNGGRVGFVGSITPTLEWSAVTDDSGVSYSLQIGSSANFTAPVLSLTGLTEASYTLTDTQALSYGTYYWRVKAIDGAQNDSGWTATYDFQAGLLSLWLFIVIIALVVVLIGVVVYLFVRRRGYYD